MQSPALSLAQCLKQQREAHRADPYPDLERRKGHLAALHRFLQENEAAIIEAIEADFCVRPATETRLLELFPVRQGIRDATRHLAKWMRSQLSFGPLVDILAAGNHAMVKMSDRSAHLARLLIEVLPRYVPTEKVAFFADLGRGPEFSKLPFDHMLFTGSSGVGRAVMAAAAANLCPVTLELGGKAPAVVAPDFPLATAAQRILWAKCINAGQVCVNVDDLFLPEGSINAFVAHAKRLVATLEDAKARGATVINLAPDQQLDARRRKLAPHIVLGVNDEMTIMKEEIFGPFLPIKPYREVEEVIAYVNGHDRPLAFYPFTNDKRLAQRHITEILSGSVGASGMGRYHDFEGFLTFSKLRSVFRQGRFSSIQLALQPPYGERAKLTLDWMFRLRG